MIKLSKGIQSISFLGIVLAMGMMSACNQSSGTPSSGPVAQAPTQPPAPPEKEHLTDEELELLRKWIDQGAL